MANYDAKPSKLEAVGNGSYLYRFNIEEKTVEHFSEGTLCPVSHEQKLVNEYNAANLGLVGGSKTSDAAKTAIARYKEFLEQRTALKSMVDADCEELGIR